MKDIKYTIAAVACAILTLSSCMGSDYADPAYPLPPYGNNQIAETNVISISALKNDPKYKSIIQNSSYTEITEDIQIKGRVTGNDIQGNLYNEFAIQDSTGAIIISVSQGGINGYLPVGQEVVISLKGMNIGGYGSLAELGGVYTSSSGAKSIGRMNRMEWEKHYKLIGTPDPTIIQPEIFDQSKMADANYLWDKAGMLMTLQGVTISGANGTAVYAPNDNSYPLTANAANRPFIGISEKSLVLRTSTYADFANVIMPTTPINVTGIFTRFRNTWQILLRTADDVTSANPFDGIAGNGEGTQESPFNVARAISLITNNKYDSTKEVYISGTISEIKSVDTGQYGNAEYFISDDGTTTNQLQVYHGFYLNGEHFTSPDQIKVGQKILLLGKLTSYNGTPEVNSYSKIISLQ